LTIDILIRYLRYPLKGGYLATMLTQAERRVVQAAIAWLLSHDDLDHDTQRAGIDYLRAKLERERDAKRHNGKH